MAPWETLLFIDFLFDFLFLSRFRVVITQNTNLSSAGSLSTVMIGMHPSLIILKVREAFFGSKSTSKQR